MHQESPTLDRIFYERKETFLKILTRKLGDENDAEETLQEAFIKFQNVATSKAIENPDAYLLQIALNLAIDKIRQDSSRRKRESQWFEIHSPGELNAHFVAATPAPDHALVVKDELAQLAAHVNELTPQVRTAFILHKFHGLSHSQTAEEMNLARSTVEKHIMKAMRHLVERMADLPT